MREVFLLKYTVLNAPVAAKAHTKVVIEGQHHVNVCWWARLASEINIDQVV